MTNFVKCDKCLMSFPQDCFLWWNEKNNYVFCTTCHEFIMIKRPELANQWIFRASKQTNQSSPCECNCHTCECCE